MFRATAGVAAPLVLSRSLFGSTAPSNRITVGMIGMGTQMGGHFGDLLSRADVQVVAVCDVWQHRIDQSIAAANRAYANQRRDGTYNGCAAYRDFRELLARMDIDAVVIATPDHWHAVQSIAAMRAGKDVYCEKPLTRTIGEARAVVETARRYGTVFQTGSQQRSHAAFRTPAEMVRSGRIGRVKTIHVNVGDPAREYDLPAQPTPDTLDWDMWLGPAQWRPYHEVICPKRDGTYPAWRHYRELAGGGLADMGAHHFDIAQWSLDMDASGPVEVIPPTGDANSGAAVRFTNGTLMYHAPNCVNGTGLRWEGEHGSITAVRWHFSTEPASIGQTPLGPGEVRLYQSNNHMSDWLDCIRSRRRPVADVEIGARTAVLCHLYNIVYQLRRPLRWDAANWRFVNDESANRLIDSAMRSPWRL